MTPREALLLLEVNEQASFNDVKAAYRRLAMQYHPDLAGEGASAHKFLAIQAAWEFLRELGENGWKNDVLRADYGPVPEKGNREVTIPETQFYRDLEDCLLALHVPISFLTQKRWKRWLSSLQGLAILGGLLLLPALIAFAFVAAPLYLIYAVVLDRLYGKLSAILFFTARAFPVVVADVAIGLMALLWIHWNGFYMYLFIALALFIGYMHICLAGAWKRLQRNIPY